MTISLPNRMLSATFLYGQGNNGEQSFQPQFTVSKLRATAKAVVAGGQSMGELQLAIYGMTQSHMNQFSSLGKPPQLVRRNAIIMRAGNAGEQLSQFYQGTIFSAWFSGRAAPQISFNVLAHAGLIEQMVPLDDTIYPSAFKVADAVQALADQMGLTYEGPNGVDVTLPASHLIGTGRQQIEKLKQAARINAVIDNNILAIWPLGGLRNVPTITIQPGDGTLIGYPEFTAGGLIVETIFNRAIRVGCPVEVKGSILPQANGSWVIATIHHDLDTLVPGGNWKTELLLLLPTSLQKH